ncbi:hypothetical protein [Myxococcus qinghaiensis]|uniref:hypothetical protein n=1 Tax=Myxococcus qinghaiensis TaxID=2906758 RepID=UPI0020A8102A|nr:hypothetical protein [Myxococcus qinghaiensis]MCP3169336.1 hypothetical protein [Myxococcus qinghaiensis]
MRTVRLEGPSLDVSDDPNGVIGEFLAYALSLKNLSGREPAEEFAERFSPEGQGMSLPDVFMAYRAEGQDDLPPELGEEAWAELGEKEPWVLSRLQYGWAPESAVLEGAELRHLLQESLLLRGVVPPRG